LDTAEIDLRRYIEILWKWRLVIVLLTAAAVVASAVFSFFVLSPVYETRVTLLVINAAQNQQSVRSAGDLSVAETVSKIPAMTLNTYMSQMMNPYFLSRVVGKLQLPNLAPTSLSSMVSAQVLKDTSLVEVRVQNTDRALAAKIANTIASEFVQFVSEQNQERMSKSIAFLQEQETTLKKDLANAYAALSRAQSKPDSVASLSREISSTNQVIVNLMQEQAKRNADVDVLKGEIAKMGSDLKTTQPTLGGMPGDGQTGPPNPEYEKRAAELTAKKNALGDATNLATALERQIASLESSLPALEAKLAAAQNEEAVAKADVARLESTLNLLSSKMVEAQMAHSLNLGDTTISVVSPALEPDSPVKPRKAVNMAVAGILGGFVAVLLVFVLEYMDNTLKTQDDVAKYLNLGTLGAIPVMESRQRRKK
jgi:capsular polysaccharide biosynthesis protein